MPHPLARKFLPRLLACSLFAALCITLVTAQELRPAADPVLAPRPASQPANPANPIPTSSIVPGSGVVAVVDCISCPRISPPGKLVSCIFAYAFPANNAPIKVASAPAAVPPLEVTKPLVYVPSSVKSKFIAYDPDVTVLKLMNGSATGALVPASAQQ